MKDAPINLPPHFFATWHPEDDNCRSIIEEYSEAYARAAILADRAAASAEQTREVLIDVTAHLVAAVSLLEGGGKKSAWSDKVFYQMIEDYKASIERGRALLAAPSPAEPEWEWFGYPGHFICADRCRFRMTTKVGTYLISTVGDMRRKENGKMGNMETLGARENSFFETYVFRNVKRCDEAGCTCGGQPILTDACEIDGERNATAEDARAAHFRYCQKYSAPQPGE